MTATTTPSDRIQRQPAPGGVGDAGSPLRIPVIAVNLLPAEIIEARRDRRVRRAVIISLVVVVLLVAAWFAQATYGTSAARDRLDLAQDTVGSLTGQQNSFADLTNAQAQSKLVGQRLAQLLADDLPWSTLLTSLQAAAPAGVKVTAVFGGLLAAGGPTAAPADGGAASGGPGDGGAPGVSTTRQVGTLTISASAPDEMAAAAYSDALAAVPGLANPLLGDVIRQEGLVQFSVRLDITSQMLGGRHTPTSSPAAAPSAGGP